VALHLINTVGKFDRQSEFGIRMSTDCKKKAHMTEPGRTQLLEFGVALAACIIITALAFTVTVPLIPIEWIWRVPQILFPIAVVLIQRGTLEDLGLTGGSSAAKNVDLGILTGILLAAAFLPLIYVGLWSPMPGELRWDTFFYTVCTILLTVTSIEIFYRGYLQPRFEAVTGFAPALVATSLLCGLDFFEYKLLSPAPAIIGALVFGFLFKKTRSLITPMMAHSMFIFLLIAAHVF
jgi:membrane protease YdiL (CAAX protease family)